MTEWLTVAEFADRIKVHKQTAYRMVWAGEIAVSDISTRGSKRKRLRINAKHVQSYLESRELASPKPRRAA